MKNISKYILVAIMALSLSACDKPKESAIDQEVAREKAEESQWHHCTADVDCVLVKTGECVNAVDNRFKGPASEYYADQPCVDTPHDPMAVCVQHVCEIRAR